MSITFYNIALVTHVIGLTIMAGATFIDYITFRRLCKVFQEDNAKASVLEDYIYRLQRFIGIGILVILLSGITMMVKLHEVWGAQLWFRIKMGVLLLVIINGLGIRRMLGSRLRKIMIGNIQDQQFQRIRQSLTIVQVIQMGLFVIIYVLSVFKFN
jgi:hypothetical protein